MELNDSVSAIVTGGASGLGEATARELASRKVKVVIFDFDHLRGEKIAAELGCTFVKVNVGDGESVKRGFKTAREVNGQERLLVNCAGVGSSAKTVSKGTPHDTADFSRVISINLTGTFNCASISAAGMTSTNPLSSDGERGLIVNTASIAAFDGQIGQVAYAASKAGVAGMTLPMARDLSRDGIRVVAIAPGLFDTQMLRSLPDDIQKSLANQTPFPTRLGHPGEYAKLVTHIAQNLMLNGETIRLDGANRLAFR